MPHLSTKPLVFLLPLLSYLGAALILIPHITHAAGNTYYVATDGSDSNPGTQTLPFRTINHGLAIMDGGDTLLIRGGTYTENIDSNKQTVPSGTSWSNAGTIAAYPGETVTLHGVNFAATYIQYVILDGLIIDGSVTGGGISMVNGAPHIRIQNGEVKNAQASGIFASGAPGNSIEVLNMKVHHNGSSWLDHGVYLGVPNIVVDGGDFYNNSGYGIQIYGTTGAPTDNTIIGNNRVHDNQQSEHASGGVTISHGSNMVLSQFFI